MAPRRERPGPPENPGQLPNPVTAPAPSAPAGRGISSARLFFWATVSFLWTAASLFLELPSREGLLGRIGWGGLALAGPATVLLVILALRRYSSEVAAAPNGDDQAPATGNRGSKTH